MARSDASGRVVVPRPLLDTLGWEPAARLSLSFDAGRYRLVRDESGPARLDNRCRLVMPESAWRFFGLACGVVVLLSADRSTATLTVSSAACLDEVVA